MSNLLVNDLTVLGKIVFSDSTQQSTSNTPFIQKVLAIQRDAFNQVTKIQTDNVVIEKDVTCAQKISTDNLSLKRVLFLNDLDLNGLPQEQTKAFTEDLRSQITSSQSSMNLIVPDIIDPPLKKAKLNSAEWITSSNSTIVTPTSIEIKELTGDVRSTIQPNACIFQQSSGKTGTLSLLASGTMNVSTPLRIQGPSYQQLDSSEAWNSKNGYLALSKETFPRNDPISSSAMAVATWNLRPTVNDALDWRGITWSPRLGIFVAISRSGTTFQYSANGVTWIASTSGVPAATFRYILWAENAGKFVVSNDALGGVFLYSTDGISWSNCTMPAGVNRKFDTIMFSPQLNRFVSLGITTQGTGGKVLYSDDGITWLQSTTIDDGQHWRALSWSPELLLFVSISGTTAAGLSSKIMTSVDGINWIDRGNAPVNANYTNIVWSTQLGIFVCVSDTFYTLTSHILTSKDGITWTERTNPANYDWFGLSWAPQLGIFCCTSQSGTGNRVMSSPDGINWTLRSTPADSVWSALSWSPELGIFATVANSGTGNRVMTSSLVGRIPTSYNVFGSTFNYIDGTGHWTFKAKQLTSDAHIELVPSSATGDLILTGTNLEKTTAGGSSGNYLRIKLNGVYYKIALLLD